MVTIAFDALKFADHLATTAGIAAVRADIPELELRMTIKLGGLMVVAVGVILAAIRYPPVGHP